MAGRLGVAGSVLVAAAAEVVGMSGRGGEVGGGIVGDAMGVIESGMDVRGGRYSGDEVYAGSSVSGCIVKGDNIDGWPSHPRSSDPSWCATSRPAMIEIRAWVSACLRNSALWTCLRRRICIESCWAELLAKVLEKRR
jgi:hypothetical protein